MPLFPSKGNTTISGTVWDQNGKDRKKRAIGFFVAMLSVGYSRGLKFFESAGYLSEMLYRR